MSIIYNGDCLSFLHTHPGRYATIIADPPDNIGYGYDVYPDKLSPRAYYTWCEDVITAAWGRCDALWFSYNAIHDLNMTVLFARLCAPYYRRFIWRYTFGSYTDNAIPSGYRNIILVTRGQPLNLDAIRTPSVRMELGDKRAAGLRVPDDVWDFPRVTGNNPERRAWHPTQHPVIIYKRMIALTGAPVLDIFAGSGTVFAAEEQADGIELSSNYCTQICQEFGRVRRGLV